MRNVFVRDVTARTGPRGYVGSLVLFPSALSHPLSKGYMKMVRTLRLRYTRIKSLPNIEDF
jgi:hypothetical protein